MQYIRQLAYVQYDLALPFNSISVGNYIVTSQILGSLLKMQSLKVKWAITGLLQSRYRPSSSPKRNR